MSVKPIAEGGESKALKEVIERQKEEILELRRQSEKQEEKVKGLEMRLAQAEVMLKERNKTLHSRDLIIASHNQEVSLLNKKINEMTRYAEMLQTVAAEQDEELNDSLQTYTAHIDSLAAIPTEEAVTLTVHFTKELQRQIQQAEEANQTLEQTALQLSAEVVLQNEQATDLLGDVEYIMDAIL